MRRLLAISLFFFVWASSTSATAQSGLENEIKDMDWIGFRQFHEVSQVFVRTTEPVKYRIDSSKPNVVILTLENTRIPATNNRRHLDTRFFESPVTYIKPKVIEGASPSVQITIHLRSQVPFTEEQKDNVLALNFQRIGSQSSQIENSP